MSVRYIEEYFNPEDKRWEDSTYHQCLKSWPRRIIQITEKDITKEILEIEKRKESK